MSNTATVKVTSVKRDSKGFKADDGRWYSGFNKINVSVGEVVTFKYKENNVRGTTYYNIDGPVSATSAPTSGPSNEKFQTKKEIARTFPIAARDGQRSIIRQNAMAHAVAVLGMVKDSKATPESMIDHAILLARKVEAYTTGDLDIEIAAERSKKAKEEEAKDELLD